MSLRRNEERNERHPVLACCPCLDENYGDVGTVILPRKETLKKYGLSLADWMEMYHLQNGLCPICEKPLDVRICVDHYHVRGFKGMKPENKKKYVRGLLHWFCNRYYLGRSMTLKKARNVVAYLERFEKRINAKET